MSDPTPPETSSAPAARETCARCSRELSADDRRPAGDKVFCASCYETLREEVRQAVTAMSTDIPYPAATLGALLGGAAGALVWWGFTALTKIAFGLIAVGIGFLVGFGTNRFAGGKRSGGLQAIAVGVSVLSFVAGTYLVNRTFINAYLAKQGESFRVPLVPPDLTMFVNVIKADFGIMELVFLGIAVYQAWVLTRPLRLPGLESPSR